MIESIHLAGGLARDRVAAFSELVADITGVRLAARPVLAPALLFSDPGVQGVLALPFLTADTVLLQDYQSLSTTSEMPLDTPLDAVVEKHASGANTEFTCTPYPGLEMKSGLRLLPRIALGDVAPMRLGPTAVLARVTCHQDQVETYLALSGDANPMHQDVALARDLGLAAPVVPGILLIALIQPCVETEAPGGCITSLRARFAAPILVGQPVSISVTPRGEGRFRAVLFDERGAFALIDVTISV